MITPNSLETEGAPKPLGSCIIYEAESLDAVKKMVESDVYYTAGVVSALSYVLYSRTLLTGIKWDREKLVIVPFLSATPFP